MPRDRGRGAINTEDVDEDDMPPIDGNPSLTYTFHSGMTPLSFTSHSAPTATQDVSPHPSKALISSPPPSPLTPSDESSMPAIQTRPHGKRRDPSYIPRPPNAFILFRSAFIRDQHIPGKVEGNHSKLSKIIGMYWKKLTPAEKEKWEAQALVAQEEHRARYPDWRFRPGANAMAKLKVGEGSTAASRRRSVRSRAKGSSTEDDELTEMVISDVKGKGKDKGKAREKGNRMASIEEKRCAKIAGFVAEGLKGEELEVAVKQWESDRHITRPETRPKKVKAVKSRLVSTKTPVRSDSDASLLPSPASPDMPVDETSEGSTPTHTQTTRTPTLDHRRLSPSSSHVNLTSVPLTQLFRRSLSAPAADQHSSHSRSSSDRSKESSTDNSSPASTEPTPGAWGKPLVLQGAPTGTNNDLNRRDNLPFSTPSSSSSTATYDAQRLTWQETENRRRLEDMQTPDSWWPQRPSTDESHSRFSFDTPKQRVEQSSVAFNTENMGYETEQQTPEYDRGYLEQYRSFEPVRDGSQNVEWTNLSATGSSRQGLVSIVKDPYEDDCDTDQQTVSQPPTLSIPPPTGNSYYFQPVSPVSPSAVPSSTFSTLSGWDGDSFKHPPTPITSARAWSDHTTSRSSPIPSPSINSSGWYNSSGMYAWGDHRPQLQHTPLSLDSQDWDRQEYRASSQMHLRTDPPRQVDFQEELRRMNRS
ncbi:hypothetical protein CPB83DRAFT_860322 [Crepidotus variabilis]|uniref:HMG box domain-containing protein n=1 Tax=Crepidotus variabilis TaxID=179855 RepID=A0A9P6E912_9AGAR|nr:hypothetical protein CPB83DRAFT_860322 [Crepidotus variabilis]